MLDANVPDIAMEPDKTMKKVGKIVNVFFRESRLCNNLNLMIILFVSHGKMIP